MTVTNTAATWVKVCDAAELTVGFGVSALVRGKQVALFRALDRTIHAVANRDPYSGRHTMARSLMIERGGAILLAAPDGRQLFDLASGRSVDDPMTRLQTYPVRVLNGVVEVSVVVRA